LGDIARQQGQVVRALKFYRQALAIDPGHAGVINACAGCMERLGDIEAAIVFLTDGLRHAPRAGDLRMKLSALLERQGRGDEAARVRDTTWPQAAA